MIGALYRLQTQRLSYSDGMIKKTMLASGAEILQMDTIRHEGQFWLVPDWIESPDGKHGFLDPASREVCDKL